MAIDQSNEDAATTSYAYKASLIGSAHRFELTDTGLSWHIAGRSGVWPYADIAAIRLSYRPISMQSRRFRADIENKNGGRIAVLSTTWQTVTLMVPQDHGYRAFIVELHAAHAEGRQHGRAVRRPRAEDLCRRGPGAGVARCRHGGTSAARVVHRRVDGARCSWSALPPVRLADRRLRHAATGRGATASTICRKDCCLSLFVATKRNEM